MVFRNPSFHRPPDKATLSEFVFSLYHPQYWRQRRKLKREIMSAFLEFYNKPYDSDRATAARRKHDSLQVLLDILESNCLLAKAERLGVEVSSEKPDWWYPKDFFKNTGVTVGEVLSEKGQDRVHKLIRRERRQDVEWWVKILSPILALIVSALGLILALTSIARR